MCSLESLFSMVSAWWLIWLEGRDKITKIFQYFAKFCGWFYLRRNAETSIIYFLISERAREARQMFRLVKSLMDGKMIQMISNSDQDRFSKVTNILSHTFYLLHWLFENVYILAKICNLQKIWPNFDIDKYKRVSRGFHLVGLALFLVYCCKTLRKTYTDESDLKVAAINKMTV